MTRHTARVSLQFALQGAGDGWATSIIVGTFVAAFAIAIEWGLGL